MFLRFIVGFFALNALVVIAVWGMLLGANPFSDWLLQRDFVAGVPLLQVAAEVLMALLAFIGAGYALSGRGWGWPLVLFAAGMFFYSAIASLPRVYASHPLLTLPMIVTGVAGAILVGTYVTRTRNRADL